MATANHQSRSSQVVLRQPYFWLRAITWSLIGTTGFAVAWLFYAQTEEVVVASGKIEPTGKVTEIQIPLGGVVDKVEVQSGETVQKGQVLVRMDSQVSNERLRSVQNAIRIKLLQKNLKEHELSTYLKLNETEASMLSRNLVLDQEMTDRLETLSKEGAAGQLQYLQQKNKMETSKGQLSQNRVDRERQRAILEQQIQQLNADLSDLSSRLTDQVVTSRYELIRAPVTGVVFDLKPRASGFVAQASDPVMKIVPKDKLLARVEIPSNKIGFVRIDQTAEISIDSFPSTDFGSLPAKIKSIGSDALPPNDLQREYRFPAELSLSSQSLKTRDGKELPLQVGMSLTANIKLRKLSYLQILLGSFKDKADSLRTL
ncbi:HlyD family secretion protein [Synechococcus sp. 1G10]|uniref:HlyD family secretion protein n=1 Tax=Synechococcus sp. 1G10 TaxID=2025605 RepID=UPI000B98009B|nr:HlyD family efflux transporter periplasmic adaptor subunit [Synechococcus sp. 1G10]